MRRVFAFTKVLIGRYKKEEVTSIAGELAYFLLLSLFPLLFVLLQIISYLPIDQDALLTFLNDYAPEEAMMIISTFVTQVINRPSSGLLSFGIIGVLWSSSRGSKAMIRGMNKAFHVEETRPYWKIIVMSILLVLGMIFVIIFSLLIPIFGQRILDIVYNLFELKLFESQAMWNIFRSIGTFLVLYFAFTVAYYVIPNKDITFKQVMPGSLFTTLGWMGTSYLFFFYVENFSNYSVTYGSIGSIMVLMTWIYLSCIVLILGAIVNSIFVLDKEDREQQLADLLATVKKGGKNNERK